jgi:hypothetical protein
MDADKTKKALREKKGEKANGLREAEASGRDAAGGAAGAGNARNMFLPLICAAALTFVPLYFLFAGEPAFFENEKRFPAAPPRFELDAALSGAWGEDVEKWLADKMPLRSQLVGLNAYWTLATGRQNSTGIYLDGTGALLEAPVSFDDAQLYARLDKIAALIGGMGAADARAAVLAAPSAGYCAKRYLPDYIWREYRDDELFEKISARLNSDNVAKAQSGGSGTSGAGGAGSVGGSDDAGMGMGVRIGFADMRGAFLGLGGDPPERPFYRTDRHWNAHGAYLAYTQLCGYLGIVPNAPEYFSVSSYENFYGTAYSSSGLWLTKPDAIELWSPPDQVEVTFSDREGVFGSLFFRERLDAMDKYPVFLDGNHPLTTIANLSRAGRDAGSGAAGGVAVGTAGSDTTGEAGLSAASGAEAARRSGRTLLVVKDSFANSIAPLLIAHYDKMLLVDLRYYRQSVSELIGAQGVDDVLFIYSANNLAGDQDLLWLR